MWAGMVGPIQTDSELWREHLVGNGQLIRYFVKCPWA
jgi:hypothetical protein